MAFRSSRWMKKKPPTWNHEGLVCMEERRRGVGGEGSRGTGEGRGEYVLVGWW
jgi:hypothetical protein